MHLAALTSILFFAGLGLTQSESSLGSIFRETTTPATRSAAASPDFSSWTNYSSHQAVATIQIQIGDLLGSGVIKLNSIATTSDPQGRDSFSPFTPTLTMSDGPQQTDSFPILCNETSSVNTTTITPRFINSTLNFNATAGPSIFATPTPTAPSILTSSGVRGSSDILALLSVAIIQIAIVFFI